MYHVHHIIPRHMGGTDDPSNLIKLTVQEHANEHKKLYEKYGKKEDLVAWKSLSAQIGKEEIFFETSSIGGLNNMGKPKSEEHKKKISEALSGRKNEISDETRERISESMKGNSNSKNHGSAEYKKTQSEAMKKAWAKRKAKKPA